MKQHDGKVPHTLKELTNLPGVARKTAVLTLNEALGQFAGIGWDVHVSKMTEALGFVKIFDVNQGAGPQHAERALREFVPEKQQNVWLFRSIV